jgi:hypothetical protein
VTGDRRRTWMAHSGRTVDAVYVPVKREQYPADYEHQVVITEATRRGRAKRHTFARRFPEVDGPGKWRPEPPRDKQLRKQLREQQSVRIPGSEPLKPGTLVPLADGVDLPATTLAVILEALASRARHQIDLADVKLIVSQLGSRIAQLDTLSVEQRRLAEPALYTAILARCTTISPVSDD